MQVFLSFASEQKAVAEPILLALRQRGHKVFFSHDDLPRGDSYDLRIEKAVEASELVVFLVSPESVAQGRYTLTELAFARAKWPAPEGRVLPVMVAPTPMDRVPSYLKAVSILEPLGSAAAETAAAVDKMLDTSGRKLVRLAAIGGVVTGLISAVQFEYVDFELLAVNAISTISPIPGVLFGLLLAACNWRSGLKDKFSLVLIVVFTALAWLLAVNAFNAIGGTVGEYSRIVAGDASLLDGSSGEKEQRFPFADFLGGVAGGGIGGLLTVLGIAAVNPRFRRFEHCVLIVGAATVLGGALTQLAGTLAAFTFFVLFVPWQSVVAALIARTLTLRDRAAG